MDDFVIDFDPYIPTGVPATPERVAEMVVTDIVPPESVPQLATEQQPDAETLGAVILTTVGEDQYEEKKAVLEDGGLEVIALEEAVTNAEAVPTELV